jgi:light-regulated signal transduction histidine kinase (bacteriophytochrome)
MVENEPRDAELAEHALRESGLDFTFRCVDTRRAFVRELGRFEPTVVLSDHGLAAFDGLSVLSIVQKQHPEVPVIFVTGSLGEPAAAKALKHGAAGFVLKHRLTGLAPALQRALREAEQRAQRLRAEEEIRRLNDQLEHRIAQRTAELESANRELDAFSYSVSHELRTPLRHIEGYIEIVRDNKELDLDEETQNHLKTVASAARHMSRLIDDLLAFSRTSRVELHKRNLSLARIVEAVLRELTRETAGRKVEWIVGKLPDVEGDPTLLRQVISNLLGNALKYTRRAAKARIEIGFLSVPPETVIFVSDNGVGFDMRYADKLFGVFQRLHGGHEFEGTGVGLAIVRRIIHRHGGRTWAEAAPGRGATFYISLPNRVTPRAASEIPTREKDHSHPDARRQPG